MFSGAMFGTDFQVFIKNRKKSSDFGIVVLIVLEKDFKKAEFRP